jgi:gas vesicle protein
MKDSSKLIVATLAGVAVGAGIGILYAPASGKDTRKNISDKANEFGEAANEFKDTVASKIEEAKNGLEKKVKA